MYGDFMPEGPRNNLATVVHALREHHRWDLLTAKPLAQAMLREYGLHDLGGDLHRVSQEVGLKGLPESEEDAKALLQLATGR
jgi:hypothetical protein